MTPGTVLAVAGCKGGVGKTTTAINLGTAAAAREGDVMLVETDLAMANVVDFLDIGIDADADPTLHEVLAGDAATEDAVYETNGGLHVLPCGTTIDGYARANPNRIGGIVRSLRGEYDLVFLDTPAGVSRATLLPLAVADGVVLVSTPRVSAVRDLKKTAEIVERLGGTTVGLVITHVGTGNAPPAERIAEFLGVDLLGSVPEDATVATSQDAGEAVVAFEPDAPSARAYLAIADRLDGLEPRASETRTAVNT